MFTCNILSYRKRRIYKNCCEKGKTTLTVKGPSWSRRHRLPRGRILFFSSTFSTRQTRAPSFALFLPHSHPFLGSERLYLYIYIYKQCYIFYTWCTAHNNTNNNIRIHPGVLIIIIIPICIAPKSDSPRLSPKKNTVTVNCRRACT